MKQKKIAQMPLRLPAELHEELKQAAAQQGLSLNQYCLYLLSRYGLRAGEFQTAQNPLRFLDDAASFVKTVKGGMATEAPTELEFYKKWLSLPHAK